MTKEICRLCLGTNIDNTFQTLDEALKDSFYILFSKLNMDISLDTEICNNCGENLQVFFNFVSTCDHMKDRIVNVDLELEDLENLKSVEDEIRCYFCRDVTVQENFTSLNGSKENIFLIEMLKEYVPDLDLTYTEDLLTCEICLNLLQRFSNFIINCLNVEERIKQYTEIEGTNEKGQINLKDVKQFIFKPTIKLEHDILQSYQKHHEIVGEEDIKPRELDIKTDDIDIKSEEIDIKTEQLNESYQESPTEIKLDNGPVEKPESKPKIYSYWTNRTSIKLTDKDSVSMKVYQCETCTYQTTCKNALNDHMLIHQSSSKMFIFKCDECAYETKHKSRINQHILIHKSSSEISMFKCDQCTYETKRKYDLNTHKLTHKSPSEISMFKCDQCTFQTKYKQNLNAHKLLHKSTSEISMFRCEQCTYMTRRKHDLHTHKLIHKSPSEIAMFKCDLCTYQGKDKQKLKKHKLIHKSPSEISMFKCDQCTFETKYKQHHSRHKLNHKRPSEMIMFKCEECTYQTKHKAYMNCHKLIHKSLPEVSNKIQV